MQFLTSLRLNEFLSFAPDSGAITLTPLNVLIGPNGSGKSNLIEAIELLHSTPTAFASAIRDGGGVREWLWKGSDGTGIASIEASISGSQFIHGKQPVRDLRYLLRFTAAGHRTEVTEEVLEEKEKRRSDAKDVYAFYRYRSGNAFINVRERAGKERAESHHNMRNLERQNLVPDESVFSQRKEPDLYPELTWVGRQFGRIQTFREWSFGRYAILRQPQPADLPADNLLPDSRNLGLILNHLEHSDVGAEFNHLMNRFLPRYKRLSTLIEGAAVQFYLHEDGLNSPVAATRLSDGTIRFLAILALLLSPDPPPLICLEEPELGLHPDAFGLLANLMVEASTRTQLIVTTHSDALVSALTDEADSVLICEHAGGTVFSRIESGKLRHWLDKYRLGEIWRIGQLGGNP